MSCYMIVNDKMYRVICADYVRKRLDGLRKIVDSGGEPMTWASRWMGLFNSLGVKDSDSIVRGEVG